VLQKTDGYLPGRAIALRRPRVSSARRFGLPRRSNRRLRLGHGAIRLCADCVGRLPKRSLATRRVTEPGWCESCGSHGAEAFRLPLAEYARALRRRAAGTASSRSDPSTVTAPTVSARCPICSGAIEPTDSARLVFRPDGRVEHGRCPDPVCPWCLQAVAPSQPRLRSGRDIFHRDCLRASRSERLISSGSGMHVDGDLRRAARPLGSFRPPRLRPGL
jgi:hypothetical protein